MPSERIIRSIRSFNVDIADALAEPMQERQA
jgi:hypothetical protein